ncbi:cholesterol esterase [Corynebacterium terpenotabidum Y-11]|uniref:Cholesterol esterase n=2 Tax=Corynebacterium terpenotabidum TaxID=89154 RepID=S4XL68_9CORY|nr:cholesterol esterase [Corynebacterium terpenotabidum Y-11]
MAQGGISANLALSGTIFKISMDRLDGSNFNLFVIGDQVGDSQIPVSRLTFSHAEIADLCLSAKLPGIPGIGDVTFLMRAPGENAADAENLVVGATSILGDLSLTEPQIGADVNQVNPDAPVSTWGIVAPEVEVKAQDVQASSIGADKLNARGVTVNVERGVDGGC